MFNSQEAAQRVDVTGSGNIGFNDSIFQNVPTSIGASFTLSYWIGRANGVLPDNRYLTPSTVFVGVDGTLITPSINSDVGAPGTITWKSFSYSFTASSATTQIGFFNGTPDVAGGGNNFAGVDRVSMSIAPEPSTVLIGLAAAYMFARRRQQA